MKHTICSFAVLIVAASSFGQPAPSHEWNATITVVDEFGEPVSNANVAAIFSTFTEQHERIPANISGLSGTNGVFHASHTYTGASAMLFRASKAGFYATAQPYDLGYDYNVTRWNPNLRFVLKKVGHPIPMYAKFINLEVPAFEKPIGFDLSLGDWVAPYGKGNTTDILFTSHYYNKRAKNDFDHELIITFPNPGDGIQPLTTRDQQSGSDLRSPHKAPAEGYDPKLVRNASRHPGQTIVYDYDENRAYFFQVRTVLDQKGAVKSALYGKIYGDFMQFTYYLNPTPNDRNVEFAPNQNLLLNQHVTAP